MKGFRFDVMVFNFHHLKVAYKDGDKWSLMDFDFLQLKFFSQNQEIIHVHQCNGMIEKTLDSLRR